MEDVLFGISARDWSEIVRNYALTIVAGISAWVAWSGLSAWKKQKFWEEDAELSRETLKVLYELHFQLCNYPDTVEKASLWLKKTRSLISVVNERVLQGSNIWGSKLLKLWVPYNKHIQTFLDDINATDNAMITDNTFHENSYDDLFKLTQYLQTHSGRQL